MKIATAGYTGDLKQRRKEFFVKLVMYLSVRVL